MKTKVEVVFTKRYIFEIECNDDMNSFIDAQRMVFETTPEVWVEKFNARVLDNEYPLFKFSHESPWYHRQI